MPEITIPLVGQPTARGFSKTIGTSSKDQQFINCLFEAVVDPQSRTKNLWVMKRPGSTTTSSGGDSRIIRGYSNDMGNLLFRVSTTTVLANGTSVGTVVDGPSKDGAYSDALMSNQACAIFPDNVGAGWFLFDDARTTNFPTFTGDTHTNTTIDNIASTTGLYPGQAISGTGIQAATRIATIVSATAITTTLATTATNAGVTITKEALAKIIHASFPTGVVSMSAHNGYALAATDSRIYNSKINEPWTWNSDWFISVDHTGDSVYRLGRIGNDIWAFGGSTIETFKLTGNAAGSVLSKAGVKQGVFFNANAKTPIILNNGQYIVGMSGKTLSGATPPGYVVHRISESGIEAVSDDTLGSIIQTGSLYEAGAMSIGSKTLLLLPTANSLIYDLSTGIWSELIIAGAGTITSGFSRQFTTGSDLRSWSITDVWTDSSSAYTMTIQTQPYYLNGGKPFIIDSAELIADTQSSGNAFISCSADDYATFRTARPIDMTKGRKVISRLGRFKSNVVFKLQHSDNTAFRAQALKLHWTPC